MLTLYSGGWRRTHCVDVSRTLPTLITEQHTPHLCPFPLVIWGPVAREQSLYALYCRAVAVIQVDDKPFRRQYVLQNKSELSAF